MRFIRRTTPSVSPSTDTVARRTKSSAAATNDERPSTSPSSWNPIDRYHPSRWPLPSSSDVNASPPWPLRRPRSAAEARSCRPSPRPRWAWSTSRSVTSAEASSPSCTSTDPTTDAALRAVIRVVAPRRSCLISTSWCDCSRRRILVSSSAAGRRSSPRRRLRSTSSATRSASRSAGSSAAPTASVGRRIGTVRRLVLGRGAGALSRARRSNSTSLGLNSLRPARGSLP